MLTLNQIRLKLIQFFQDHAQVNDVVYADDFEFNAERNLTYPVVNLEFLEASISNKFLNYSFKVVVGDVAGDDAELQNEVISDSLLTAEDFFSFLQNEEGWSFSKSSRLNPFKDDSGDRVSGVVFTVILSVIRSQNTCATPTKQP